MRGLQRDSLSNAWCLSQTILITTCAWLVFAPAGAVLSAWTAWRQVRRQWAIHQRPQRPTLVVVPAPPRKSTRQLLAEREARFRASSS